MFHSEVFFSAWLTYIHNIYYNKIIELRYLSHVCKIFSSLPSTHICITGETRATIRNYSVTLVTVQTHTHPLVFSVIQKQVLLFYLPSINITVWQSKTINFCFKRHTKDKDLFNAPKIYFD